LVEPGVTYHQLIDYIKEHDLDMWVSFPASVKIGGPVGNTLDRGVGFNRNGEHVANFCGLEVVLASGEVLRTGLGDVGDGSAWQAFRWGFGPWVDGLFSQSNFGIVTKMGLWLMKKPPKNQVLLVAWNDDDRRGRQRWRQLVCGRADDQEDGLAPRSRRYSGRSARKISGRQ
jgi:4-cresol dehydrogenase (hydroxylating)